MSILLSNIGILEHLARQIKLQERPARQRQPLAFGEAYYVLQTDLLLFELFSLL